MNKKVEKVDKVEKKVDVKKNDTVKKESTFKKKKKVKRNITSGIAYVYSTFKNFWFEWFYQKVYFIIVSCKIPIR